MLGKGKLMSRNKIKQKYLASYILLFIFASILFSIRCLNYITGVAVLPDFILLHITNFSLSFMLMLAFGFTVLVFGRKIRVIGIVGLLIIYFNFTYEVFWPISNVPDIIDALFGLSGVITASAFLYMMNKNGVIRK